MTLAMSLRAMTAALALAVPANALAQSIVTADNYDALCRGDRVDPERLAEALMLAAATPSKYADTANVDGRSDGAVRYHNEAGLSEPRYMLAHLGVGTAPRPFGPAVDPAGDKVAAAAAERLRVLVDAELEFGFMDSIRNAPSATPPAAGARFEARRAPGAAGPLYAYHLFEAQPAAYIACLSASPPTTTASTGSTGTTGGGSGDKPKGPWKAAELRLRGTVADLRHFDDVKDAKPASISYDLDETKDPDKATFAFNVVVGGYFETQSGEWGLAPFVSFENKDTRDDADEIKKISPGLFGVWKPDSDWFDYIGLEAAWTEDLKHEAQLFRSRLYVAPQIPIKGATIFGTALYPFGTQKIAWRPELVGIIDAADIRDEGTNPQLKGIKSYLGVGGDFSNLFYLNTPGVFSNFRLRIGFRQLWLHGAIDQDTLYRRYGSLEYKPPGTEWVGIALTYEEGDNDDTFQPVDSVSLKLTFRR